MDERNVKLAIISPGRTSSGGGVYANCLIMELNKILNTPVLHLSTPRFGRFTVPAELDEITHALFMGSKAMKVPGTIVAFWPLNIAPLELHTYIVSQASRLNGLRLGALRLRMGRAAKAADGMIFASEHARSLFSSTYTHAAKKPYAVVKSGTRSLDSPFAGAVHRTSGGSTRLILVVSHLYPYKGILELVEAIAAIEESLPDDVQVRIAGAASDRRYAAAVLARIEDLGLTRRVSLAPAEPEELATLYRSASVVAFPSTCELAGSFALYDGLHQGCPTICSDRSSMPEVVRGAVTFANPYDPGEFGTAILKVLENGDERARLGNLASQWSQAAPTWGTCATDLIVFLSKLKEVNHARSA